MTSQATQDREWRRQDQEDGDEYLISTSIRLLDRDWIQAAFATKDMYWAKPLTPKDVEVLLEHSLTLGLYRVSRLVPGAKTADSPSSPRTPSPTIELEGTSQERLEQIGMARLVTDRVTTAYLSDVYVAPEYRKDDLGKWLMQCCKDIMQDFPAMRRGFLLCSPDAGKRFYEKELGFWDIGEEREKGVICMTRKGYGADEK